MTDALNSTAVVSPSGKSPMEEFQDSLKKKLRDDIANLLPEAVVQQMIAKVINDEFFAPRTVKVGHGYHAENKTIPSAFQEMVRDAAKPVLEAEARAWVVANTDKILESWRKILDQGVIAYVEGVQRATVNTQVSTLLAPLLSTLNDERSRQGMPQVFIPLPT